MDSTTFVDLSIVDDPLNDDRYNHSTNIWRRRGWKGTLFWGIVLILAVLLVNVTLLAVVETRFNITENIATLFKGSCKSMKNYSVWSHLGINVLGSALLAASNNCMRCLSAPSRKEIDLAHAKHKWMDIGVSGLRNLRFISRWRVLLWALLALSSLPLHLL